MAKKILQIAVVLLATLTTLGASSFDHLGHQLVCQCGCGQILLECNHVGCPVSGPMIKELQAQMALGLSDSRVLNWFVNKYGAVVLAAPIRGGFDLVAWIVPAAAVLIGIVLVLFLLRRWKRRPPVAHAGTSSAAMPDALNDSVRERIRRDTTYE